MVKIHFNTLSSNGIIYPVNSLKEELEVLETFYCPNCKTKGRYSLLDREVVIEEGLQYDYTELQCKKCKHEVKLKFFNPNSIFNKKNPEYKKYKSLIQYL
ncbi:MAG: hypothetical protein ACTSSG_04295 [Candidatus Heimdallarchaeaceae archaeon]